MTKKYFESKMKGRIGLNKLRNRSWLRGRQENQSHQMALEEMDEKTIQRVESLTS